MAWLNDVHMSDVEGKLGYRVLEEELEFQDRLRNIWRVPEGTESDLSSFPWFVRVFTPTTSLVKSPFLHDWLYSEQPTDPLTKKSIARRKADQMYMDGAVDEGMSKFHAWRLYIGLRMGGWIVFNRYARFLKAQNDNA